MGFVRPLYCSVLASRVQASLGKCGVGFAGWCWFMHSCKYSENRPLLFYQRSFREILLVFNSYNERIGPLKLLFLRILLS